MIDIPQSNKHITAQETEADNNSKPIPTAKIDSVVDSTCQAPEEKQIRMALINKQEDYRVSLKQACNIKPHRGTLCFYYNGHFRKELESTRQKQRMIMPLALDESSEGVTAFFLYPNLMQNYDYTWRGEVKSSAN